MSTETTLLKAVDDAADALGSVAELAQAIGVAASAPSMWKARKSIPAQHCAAIEQATGGKVMRWSLRPDDWYRIWPELIGADGAPTVPARADADTALAGGGNA